LLQKVRLGWLCKIEDYLVANRCFKCSRFNHRFRECREETCHLCAGSHKLKKCTASPAAFKFINCLTYNKHNQHKTSVTTTLHKIRSALVYKQFRRSRDRTRTIKMGSYRNLDTKHCNRTYKMQTD